MSRDTRSDVTLVAPYPRLGERHGGHSGVASYTANLAHALTDAGARVTVVAPTEPGEPPVGKDGHVTVRRAFGYGPRSMSNALRAARATKAPVVHVQHELFLYGGPAAPPGPGGPDVGRIRQLQDAGDRWWRVPMLLRRRESPALREYADVLTAVYRAVARVTGARVLVDSSKDVSHGYVLRHLRPDVDVRVLHLVRDPRAVAYSWLRRKDNPGSGRPMTAGRRGGPRSNGT